MEAPTALQNIFEQEDSQAVQALREYWRYQVCKKDPQGSPFYYLAQVEGNVRPIAVGFFEELNGNNTVALKEILKAPKSDLYKAVYGHYLNRQLENQPALYILLPKHKRGMVALVKPTDSGLRAKTSFVSSTDDSELFLKLGFLQLGKIPIQDGLFAKTPNVDHLFYKPVDTAENLAIELARVTREIEKTIVDLYNKEEKENTQGFLVTLKRSFERELLPNLKLQADPQNPKEYGFADLYAQTISYGMFTARCFMAYIKPNDMFERQSISKHIPPTNPFLKSLFKSISLHIDENNEREQNIKFLQEYKDLFDQIEDLAGMLSSVNLLSVLEYWYKDKSYEEDIIIHFYETFLEKYNPDHREILGVYYTPSAVVSYIVRSVDLILKEKFNKPLGLADPEVLILDPATGTGTFLFHVLKHLKEYYDTKIKGKLGDLGWDSYVDKHILPRLYGFELMMAPYAVAHLRLGVELQESGYSFQSGQRLGIYMTNTLEETAKKSETLFEEYIASESNEAAEIKREKPIMVIIGNPPYSGHSANNGTWIHNLMRGTDILSSTNSKTENYFEVDGKSINEKQPKWINDDYVKFMRFAQWRIDKTGNGIVAFITNHGYLRNTTFRGMRESLLKTFDEIQIMDIHGSTKKKEKSPDGSKDENVFDIQQGVAIGFFVKRTLPEEKSVHYADLWGTRDLKYSWLNSQDVNSTPWQVSFPKSPQYHLAPLSKGAQNLEEEYHRGLLISEIFPINGVGIVTARDKLSIHFNSTDVWATVNVFCKLPIETARLKYALGKDATSWSIQDAQRDLLATGPNQNKIAAISYRPFDIRYTYYTGKSKGFHSRPVREIMQHMLQGNNLAICTSRGIEINKPWQHAFCVKNIIQHHTVSTKEVNYIYPLYREPDSGNLLDIAYSGKVPNISQSLIHSLEANLGLTWKPDDELKQECMFGPKSIFNYIYAILYSPTYRTRYDEFLRRDFPKIPITSNRFLFQSLAELGEILSTCHLMDKKLDVGSSFATKGSNIVEKIQYVAAENRVRINESQYFDAIVQDVWDFSIGGQQVCEKWLKDRKGRKLTQEDIENYRYIVTAISETIDLIVQIDDIIEEHGGWPIQ